MNAVIMLPIAPHASLDAILSTSGPAFMGLFEAREAHLRPDLLAPLVEQAGNFLGACAAETAALHEAAEPVPVDDIGVQLGLFVTAWPNTSSADLRGYGPQLAEDVIERRPCHHALRSALRHLRQTSRFLPSIAEVLAALDEAQARMRNTMWHIDQIQKMLAQIRETDRA